MGNVTGWVDRHEVDDETGCWIWQGPVIHNGYGKRGYTTAHRAYYLHYVGEIEPGLVVDHLCRNRLCCNPDHLEAVTQRENLLRGIGPEVTRERHAAVTHCPRGHAYAEHGRADERGCRSCRRCQRDAMRELRARRRNEALAHG